jgi:hypothetical protein
VWNEGLDDMTPKLKVKAWAIWNVLYDKPFGLSLGSQAQIFSSKDYAKKYAIQNIPKYRIYMVEIIPLKRKPKGEKS